MNNLSQIELFPRIAGEQVSSKNPNATIAGKVVSVVPKKFILMTNQHNNTKVEVAIDQQVFGRKPSVNQYLEAKVRCYGDKKSELVSYISFENLNLQNYNETLRLMNHQFAPLFSIL